MFTRNSNHTLRFVLFPLEVFVGLAVACFWFYLRNVGGWLVPGSYGLCELAALPYLIGFIHLPAGLAKAKSLVFRPAEAWTDLLGSFGRRAAMYIPFCFVLTLGLWVVSATLNVQTTDCITHAFMARVFLHEGIFFGPFSGQPSIIYPSGFGALNSVAAAIAPLSVVQVVNLQHVLLLVLTLFLITGFLAVATSGRLWFVHSLPLAFLGAFPLYCLHPDCFYEATGRQTAPALLGAICLLPMLAAVRREGHFCLLLGVEAVLSVLALALNPTCAPFVAAALLVALGLNCHKGMKSFGLGLFRVVGTQVLFLGLAAALVLGCDRYYSGLLRAHPVVVSSFGASKPGIPGPNTPNWDATHPATAGIRIRAVFSCLDAVRAAASLNPFLLSPAITTTDSHPLIDHLREWPGRFPQRVFPLLAITLGLIASGSLLIARRHCGRAVEAGAVIRVVLTSLLLLVLLKYGITFLTGGLSPYSRDILRLRIYVGFLLLRCQLLLLFVSMLSACIILYFLARHWMGESSVRPSLRAAIAFFIYLAPFASILFFPSRSGYVTLPSLPYGNIGITCSDI